MRAGMPRGQQTGQHAVNEAGVVKAVRLGSALSGRENLRDVKGVRWEPWAQRGFWVCSEEGKGEVPEAARLMGGSRPFPPLSVLSPGTGRKRGERNGAGGHSAVSGR
jgi:hypothetical protein